MGKELVGKETQVANWSLPPEWNMSSKGIEAVKLAVSTANTKHGLYSTVPIVCKGYDCPYKNTCSLIPIDMAPTGERCPIEIAMVMKIYDDYVKELDIDETSRVDLSLIKELIDIEVTMLRADKSLAEAATFIEDVVFNITEKGEVLTKPEINKAQVLKDTLMKRRHEILSKLNATRKDKAANESKFVDPSSFAAELLKRKAQMDREATVVVDVEATVVKDKEE